jgi:hypothetical protein
MKILDDELTNGIKRMEIHKLLQDRMMRERQIFEIYHKEGIPFVIIPVLTPEQHEELLKQRDDLISYGLEQLLTKGVLET